MADIKAAKLGSEQQLREQLQQAENTVNHLNVELSSNAKVQEENTLLRQQIEGLEEQMADIKAAKLSSEQELREQLQQAENTVNHLNVELSSNAKVQEENTLLRQQIEDL